MSTTFSYTNTFTLTNARYLSSKIAGDLRQMQLFYGQPSDDIIAAYVEEATLLMHGGFLKEVTYGYRRNDEWVFALKYEAAGNGLHGDDRSGRVRPGIDITGASWGSFMTYSAEYDALSENDRQKLHSTLPIARSEGGEPRTRFSSYDKAYTSGGYSIRRRMIAPNQ